MIEFTTKSGESVWVGSTHVVSIRTYRNRLEEDETIVKLSDGTEYVAAESAFDLGMRFAKAVGSLAGGAVGTPHNKMPADAQDGPRPDRGPMRISPDALERLGKPQPR